MHAYCMVKGKGTGGALTTQNRNEWMNKQKLNQNKPHNLRWSLQSILHGRLESFQMMTRKSYRNLRDCYCGNTTSWLNSLHFQTTGQLGPFLRALGHFSMVIIPTPLSLSLHRSFRSEPWVTLDWLHGERYKDSEPLHCVSPAVFRLPAVQVILWTREGSFPQKLLLDSFLLAC